MERKVLVDIRHHALRILQKRDERLRLQGIQLTKKRYVDLQQFAAILLPPESAIFYPDGNLRGKTMENSGKQNPKTGFKSPPEHAV
jgi:hypothetical protein